LDHCIEKTFQMRSNKQRKGKVLHRIVNTVKTHAYSPNGWMANKLLHQEFGSEKYFPTEAFELGIDLSMLPEACGHALLVACNVDEDAQEEAKSWLGTEKECSQCYIDNKDTLKHHQCLPRGNHEPGNIGGVSWACQSIDIIGKGVKKGVFDNPHKKSIYDRLLKTFSRHGGHVGIIGVGLVFLVVALLWGTVAFSLRQAAFMNLAAGKKDDAMKADVEEEDMMPLVATAASAAVAVGAAGKTFGV